MASVKKAGRPPQVVLEALEMYIMLLSEVYEEASKGTHWNGVPSWEDFAKEYHAAELENRRIQANADMQSLP